MSAVRTSTRQRPQHEQPTPPADTTGWALTHLLADLARPIHHQLRQETQR